MTDSEQRFWRTQLKPRPSAPAPGVVSLGTSHRAEPVELDPELRCQHVYVVGKTGAGKTTLLRNLVAQDLAAGHGLAVIAPDDELFRDQLLPAIPRNRIDDVIFVDPAETDRPIPLNPLHLAPGERLHEKVDQTLRVFLRLVEGNADASGAHRMERILRAALHTLIETPGRTILDIRRLLSRSDAGTQFRQWALKFVSDEEVRNVWLEDYPQFPKDAHQAVLNRLARLLTPPVRNLLCTPGACLNFREAMDSRKILLFRLTARACQGAGNAHVIGQLVIAKLNLAAISREDVPHEQRPFFPVFIDEFQHFCGMSLADYEEMFSRARKYRAPLTIAHLQTGQLPEPLMRHILGTVSTLVMFQVGASDARRLCRELVRRTMGRDGPEITTLDPNKVLFLPRGSAYCRVRNKVLRLRGLPPPPDGSAEVREEVIRRSRERFGVGPGQSGPASPSASGPTRAIRLDDIDPGQVF